MSENHEHGHGADAPSDPETGDDLFLSPDESSGAEEVGVPRDALQAAMQEALNSVTGGTDADTADPPASPPAPAAVSAPAPAAVSAPAPAAVSAPAPAVVPAAAPQAASPPAAPAAEDTASLNEVEAERDEFKNRMMRLAADLENFRKRAAREKEDLRKYGIDRVVLELLPVLDNLDRALEHADTSEGQTTIVDGVRMVHKQFVTALEKHGVRGFESKGEMFDPQMHEAIQQLDTDEHETGYVLDEYQKGYYLHERLIRPALVVVAKNLTGGVPAPSEPAAEEASAEDVASADAEGESQDEAAMAPAEESEPSSEGSDEPAVN